MNISAEEVYPIIRAIEARLEWIQDDKGSAADEEEPMLVSALEKFKSLCFKIKVCDG